MNGKMREDDTKGKVSFRPKVLTLFEVGLNLESKCMFTSSGVLKTPLLTPKIIMRNELSDRPY